METRIEEYRNFFNKKKTEILDSDENPFSRRIYIGRTRSTPHQPNSFADSDCNNITGVCMRLFD